ncbi:hypothetical protein Hanom_Chr10g00937401 [Helianthus anomalus]
MTAYLRIDRWVVMSSCAGFQRLTILHVMLIVDCRHFLLAQWVGVYLFIIILDLLRPKLR